MAFTEKGLKAIYEIETMEYGQTVRHLLKGQITQAEFDNKIKTIKSHFEHLRKE